MDSPFKSEKERCFLLGITPNKSESLLRSDMQIFAKFKKIIKELSWFFIQVFRKLDLRAFYTVSLVLY